MALSLKSRLGDTTETRWFSFDDDTEARIARWDNEKFNIGLQRFRTIFQEKSRRLIEKAQSKEGQLRFSDDMVDVSDDEETELDAQCRLMARYIVRDVRTIGREDGKLEIDGDTVSYSHELGETLLRNNIDFFLWVSSKAQELQKDAYSMAQAAEKKL